MFGALLNSSLTRLVPIGLVLIAFQETLLVELQPFGVVVQVVLAFAACCGAAAGPERGAIAGFVLGLMFDMAVGTPIGSSAITMSVAGYVAGWADLLRIDTTWWVAAGFVGIASAIGETLVPVVRRFVGEEDAFVPEMVRIIPVVAVSSAVLSIVLMPLARWALKLETPEWKLPADG